MTSQLFVNKFQPLLLEDFELDTDFIQTINTLKHCNLLNVLLIGDAGTGKTSLLNSIIREYYIDYDYHTYKDNILYINNLKEQGINYYRNDVRIFCQTSSTITKKKKIIVLDDIDLINEQSQQVFRNSIDKFSHNVHFIASCTNVQKVIESIQSRFVIIKIKPLQNECLETIMKKVMTIEHIDIDTDAQKFVVELSNLSIKNMLNYLEKFKLLDKKITLELASDVCTNISVCVFDKYTSHLKNKDMHLAISILYDLFDKGYSVMDILDSYFIFTKTTIMLTEDEKYRIIPIICKYITYFHNLHEDEIELPLFTNNIYNCINNH
jgi:DNA polymerase III delta prime subunit